MRDWVLRDEYDRQMKADVYDRNEYSVPDRMDGLVVLDVGAHCGSFTRLCAERGARVFAVEPATGSFSTLVENTAHLDGVRLMQAAALDKHGTAPLHFDQNTTGSSLVKTHWHRDSEQVPVHPIEFLAGLAMASFGVDRIDFCKIDAEGAEYTIVPHWDFAPVKKLAVEFHAHFVEKYEKRSKTCRKRLASLGFVETAWATLYPDRDWFRLYKGERK
jgi:FkbM family methyltransferase